MTLTLTVNKLIALCLAGSAGCFYLAFVLPV